MECISTKYIAKHDIFVPCGKCGYCLATRKSDWTTRLEYEAKLWVDKRFVTLTYADAHLHWSSGIPQLKKSHLQEYFKKLRKAGYKLRYYAVGEYGARTYRPHYHVILFGSIPENILRSKWDKGHVHIGQVTQASIAYSLKYIVTGKHKSMVTNRVRPFATMSRKPGLGANYLTSQMREWHKSGRKNYCIIDGEKRHLPRYYKEKIFSKIDRVRIGVAAGKQALAKLRKEMLKHSNMKEPYEYILEQRRIGSERIIHRTKKNLTI